METIEYLNHSLVRSFDDQEEPDILELYRYYCLNCSAEVYMDFPNIIYYEGVQWLKLELTCEEFLIKKILE